MSRIFARVLNIIGNQYRHGIERRTIFQRRQNDENLYNNQHSMLHPEVERRGSKPEFQFTVYPNPFVNSVNISNEVRT